jgi:hypothetical protein
MNLRSSTYACSIAARRFSGFRSDVTSWLMRSSSLASDMLILSIGLRDWAETALSGQDRFFPAGRVKGQCGAPPSPRGRPHTAERRALVCASATPHAPPTGGSTAVSLPPRRRRRAAPALALPLASRAKLAGGPQRAGKRASRPGRSGPPAQCGSQLLFGDGRTRGDRPLAAYYSDDRQGALIRSISAPPRGLPPVLGKPRG